MKILKLRFKNLNSLYGEWSIDFTHAEYQSSGIFALTGDTGSGKSTILDAVCLALYGATPRLGKISKSTNDIMSRQTGECLAEVEFESTRGVFRCYWSQHRARKKADGELQQPRHEIADAESGAVIESKLSKVAERVEQATGMDFDRFTRSMLLAQGSFDTFLKAPVEEKSSILEQITGTAVYSEISKAVHERRRTEQEKLKILQLQSESIMILPKEEIEKIRSELARLQKDEAALKEQWNQSTQALTRLQNINALRAELKKTEEAAAAARQRVQDFQPQRRKLENARKAAAIQAEYAALSPLRKQQDADKKALKEAEEQFPGLADAAAEAAAALAAAEEKTKASREALTEAEPLLQQIRSLDEEIIRQNRALEESAGKIRAAETEIKKQSEEKEAEAAALQKAREEKESVQNYLNSYAADEQLAGALPGLKEQISRITNKTQDIAYQRGRTAEAQEALEEAARHQQECLTVLEQRRSELETETEALTRSRAALDAHLNGRLLREYRSSKEALLREQALVRKINQLEEERARLTDGSPCPLCGSTEHPYAQGNVPQMDEQEKKIAELNSIIERAEKLEECIREKEQIRAAAQTRLQQAESDAALAASRLENTQNTLGESRSAEENQQNELKDLQDKMQYRLNELNCSALWEDAAARESYAGVMETLEEKAELWRQKITRKEKAEKEQSEVQSRITAMEKALEIHNRNLEALNSEAEELRRTGTESRRRRFELYADKDPATEENRLKEALGNSEESREQALGCSTEAQQNCTAASARIESLKEQIKQRAPEILQKEETWKNQLRENGFSDEETYLDMLLPPAELEELILAEQTINDTLIEARSRQNDRLERLKNAEAENLTAQKSAPALASKTLEELKAVSEAQLEELTRLQEKGAACRYSLQENERAEERAAGHKTALSAQQKECARWDMLHSLIGSADGKKYRNFAQGLTFEQMIVSANRQLQKMSDRYLLIRDEQEPLELNVVDNYQAGEIRTTRNLSGGESFIVSLALALGLSRMSSRKVRVDSLFLDEGFGTLDPESLETALDTLAGLRQSGKLIGVISHVSALKDSIPTQIQLSSNSRGHSIIKGPGCSSDSSECR